MSRTHHTFIEATSISTDLWVYLYRVGDGYKLNYRTRFYETEFIEQDDATYPIVSKKRMRAASKGCYHITIDEDPSDIEMEYLEYRPVIGATPICFGRGGCTGDVSACPEGLVPECNNSSLTCVDPDNPP